MKLLAIGALASVLAVGPAFAQASDPSTTSETKPSDASMHQLLDVIRAKDMIDAMPKQMELIFNRAVDQTLAGKTLSAKQQRALEKAREKMLAMMGDMFNWQTMEPMFLEIYRSTFSQSEIDSMLSFYSSAAGQAVVAKMPLVMQNTMTIMQKRFQELMPKIQQLAREAATSEDDNQAPATKGAPGRRAN